MDLQWLDAVAAGVPPRKLNVLAAWAESGFFAPSECAALGWAESLTRLPAGSVPDAVFAATQAALGDEGTADLAYAVAIMSAFNRLGIGFRQPPLPEPARGPPGRGCRPPPGRGKNRPPSPEPGSLPLGA